MRAKDKPISVITRTTFVDVNLIIKQGTETAIPYMLYSAVCTCVNKLALYLIITIIRNNDRQHVSHYHIPLIQMVGALFR